MNLALCFRSRGCCIKLTSAIFSSALDYFQSSPTFLRSNRTQPIENLYEISTPDHYSKFCHIWFHFSLWEIFILLDPIILISYTFYVFFSRSWILLEPMSALFINDKKWETTLKGISLTPNRCFIKENVEIVMPTSL